MRLNKINIILITSLMFTGVNGAYAQVPMTKEEKKILKEADYYYSYGDYLNALSLYEKLLETDSGGGEMNFKAGKCYQVAKEDKKTAELHYTRAANEDYAEAYFALAGLYHLNYEFIKAIEYYEKYKNSKQPKIYNKDYVDARIRISNYAIQMLNDPVEVKIENIGPVINTIYPEYVPVITADESVLIFTSRRENSTGGKKDAYNHYFEDVYISLKGEDNSWLPPQEIGGSINTDNHDACVAISADGSVLITYKTDKSFTGGDLYWSRLDGDEWLIPQKYSSKINTEYLETSACLSPDENTMYFSSNQPGGHGGRDIYRVVKLPDGEWSLPHNLGDIVNTPEDDDAPFIHSDGTTLYFSSKGHNTMGGYDIYKTELQAENLWSAPENLAHPINTPDDDIYFVLSADGERGYFSSERKGGYGNQDIYTVRMPYQFQQLIMIRGTVNSSDSSHIPITAIITISNSEGGKIESVYNSNSKTGRFLIILYPDKIYNMKIESEGYQSKEITLDYRDKQGFKNIKMPIELTGDGNDEK